MPLKTMSIDSIEGTFTTFQGSRLICSMFYQMSLEVRLIGTGVAAGWALVSHYQRI